MVLYVLLSAFRADRPRIPRKHRGGGPTRGETDTERVAIPGIVRCVAPRHPRVLFFRSVMLVAGDGGTENSMGNVKKDAKDNAYGRSIIISHAGRAIGFVYSLFHLAIVYKTSRGELLTR